MNNKMDDGPAGPYSLKVVSIRLVEDPPLLSSERISCAGDAIKLIGKELCQFDREAVCVLNLDTKGHPICMNIASVGVLDASLTSPRECFKAAILANARHMILCHNHPSGDPSPSTADMNLTNRMAECGRLLGIEVLDHIIVSRNGNFSFMENGMMPSLPREKYSGIAAEEANDYGSWKKEEKSPLADKQPQGTRQRTKRCCR